MAFSPETNRPSYLHRLRSFPRKGDQEDNAQSAAQYMIVGPKRGSLPSVLLDNNEAKRKSHSSNYDRDHNKPELVLTFPWRGY